ncbi:MAG: HNH endonuclease [Caldilineales bacterium]|nr:HNH endonuclease [Caldilineales bacterium]
MAASYVSPQTRQEVVVRAQERCEYCLLPQKTSLHKHEPDHVIPLQHGGKTEISNLALACMRCNRYKGSNVGSFDPQTGKLTPFFNPRMHVWAEHFQLDGAWILPLTAEARVTVQILRLNDHERVRERARLIEVGLYGV